MKNLALCIVAGLIGTPAFAADMPVKMPVKAPPPAPAPVCIWCGFYIGANAGAVWGGQFNASTIPGPLTDATAEAKRLR